MDRRWFDCCKSQKKVNTVGPDENNDEDAEEEPVNNSLFIFSSQGWIRTKLKEIVYHKYFENMIVLMIVISSVIIALDDPLSDNQS